MKNKGQLLVSKRELTNDDLFSDEKTDEKIHRHIADINDVITEQDIRDVKTDFNMEDIKEDPETLPAENSNTSDNSPVDDDPPPITPWDVIS